MRRIIEFFSGLRAGMKGFGENIGILVNSVLLMTVYIIGVGLTSIFARLLRKRFLDTKPSKTKTYWSDLNIKKKSMDAYYRQF